MNSHSLNNIDSLLFQFAGQNRELSQKRNEINQQIKVCRADIAERRSYIETLHRNIEKLEEELKMKQSTVIHNKANAQSMKSANSLLLQYEQTLKAELESRKASYNHDTEIYEERIVSYRKIFQSHKEYYYQNPLAQKLLTLQAEKEETECRIKACDDQITMKQQELDHLTGPLVSSSSTEKLPDSVSGQQGTTEPDKQLDPQTEEDGDSSFDISSLHLNQTKNGHKISSEVNAGDVHEENEVQGTVAGCHYPEEASNELWSHGQLDEQSWADEMHTDEQGKQTEVQDQVLASTVSEVEEATEDEVEERATINEDQVPSKEDNEGLTAFSQSSTEETNQKSSPAKTTPVPSTPTFPFNFSPASSPHQGTSDKKSPAFLFSLNSDPNTPGFSGFGFDVASSQDEDSSFTFTGSFFNEKKTPESKSSRCPGFLFDQSEQSEDFQFAFSSESPQTTKKNDFPFSLNF
uniref:uncharacterized protein LOC109957148 isoform X2 n=1 Tax=Monopterus albus TaxID=43700 RepID=UPI0009B381B3|nr:uncharacterized protein LOC109957148 isoform X2 [Monopterus albus]